MQQVASMKRRPTIRDIAQAVGVHPSTAARVLKGDQRISAETALKVRAAAEKIGYKPDPMMSAFAAYRQSIKPAGFHGVLAWITNFPTAAGWHNEAADIYFIGARERAAELGYTVEEFWLRDSGMTARQASQILLARGIRGLLVPPQPKGRGHLSMDWEQFSTVAFGYSMIRPRMHLVSPSQFRNVVTLVRHLRGLGYRRLGFMSLIHMDERSDHQWSAGFQSELRALPESREIPILVPPLPSEPEFMTWYRRWQPQAIVTTETLVPLWLRSAGLRIPEDVAVAFLGCQKPDERAGIDERAVPIGRAAVDLLVGMIQRGERGIPKDPLRVLVEGTWREGQTVPAQSAPKLKA
ncbi:MAG: LacI family DNA-binding transcriptional regulator [Chthoniobacteraceae bacterium]|nr:LacI family DNA-binding transcriptional regulator [Chthoniobacteraceae bacterium]